ncbi:5'-nucleotidase C-terminal domain-containing protein [Tropicimonas sediminicola]|uniref:Predicted extracellular nuclease n=1 Tax=Tropicimonas sediminicola TaxID=1031541 RepID=A0A239DFG1_9RHOB|nr:5'-nucleotidase C-terminal domain-containing protein [Tropicimonas sediminicola]SNS31135.1 Predicted extracellular nuclease [Tropicimonas sediminicola]
MVKLNRVVGSTTGADAEFIEIFGTPGESLEGLSLIVVESDAGSSNGTIDFRLDLDASAVIGDTGFFLLGNNLVAGAYGVTPDYEIAQNAIENSSYTIALVQTSSLAGGSVTGGEVVVDAVAVTDGGASDSFFFGAPVIGPDGSFLPAGFIRLVDGEGSTAADFRFADFNIDPSSDAPRNSGATGEEEIEATELTISEIQGSGLTSDYDGEVVRTTGIVTAVSANGYYLQSAVGDGDDATSDAIYVFDFSHGLSVGDEIEIVASVTEYVPGGASSGNQPTTELVDVQEISVLATGVALPEAVLLGGTDGRVVPATSIADALAFFESLEGMLITAQDLVATSGTSYFGEIYGVVPTATGSYPILSERGTLNISEGDFNPERIQIDEDSGIFNFDFPEVNVGDRLGDVTGVLSFAFGNYELIPTVDFTSQIVSGGLTGETTSLTRTDSGLTIATYNVLNLDPNDADGDTDVADGRFDAIAAQIVENLGSPDIIGLQEIQNSDGSIISDISSADGTLQALIDAIAAAGGPQYAFIDTPDVPTTYIDGNGDTIRPVGGQPGGDIRNAFLYDTTRVSLVEGSVRTLVDGDGDEYSFFEGRIPLVAEFQFIGGGATDGPVLTVINVHLSSKSGSAPIMGTTQPFDTADAQEDPAINGSVDQRKQQAQFIADYIESLGDEAQVVVLGDFNEFEFVSPTEIIADAGLTNLTNFLPEDERYSYIFEGNSQSLDHIMVDNGLAKVTEVDNVHVNAEFAATDTRASDHDPIVARINFAPVAEDDTLRVVAENFHKFHAFDLLANDYAPTGKALFISEINGQDIGKKPTFFIEEDGKKVGIVKLQDDGTILVKATKPVSELNFTYRVSDGTYESELAEVGVTNPTPDFTLSLLHFADQEAGAAAVEDAPRLSAVLNALRGEDVGADGTLTLSSGDAFIPGLFYQASAAVFGTAGIADMQIQNELGVQAIAFGNHEFDFGTAQLAGLISGDAAGDFSALVGSSLEGMDFTGAAFPYLSANLDFSTDANMASLMVAGGLSPVANAVTSSTVIEEGGELFGIVGATTPTLARISSPGDVGIAPFWADTIPTAAELDALASEIQAEVDALLDANPEMNKVILLAHMQQLSIKQELAARLTDVDVIVAGGSNTRLLDETDRLRDGDSAQGEYPIFIENAGGTTTAVVNTDGSYKYVGRLVVDFDADGNIIPETYDPEISGAYATDAQGVADLNAEDLVDPEVQAIADAIQDQILATESNVFGISNVFLNGNRSGTFASDDPDGVRTQETNLGDLTADANLAYANEMQDSVDVWLSLKNGGGIRASIGQTVVPAGGTEFERLPNEEILDGDGNVAKPAGGISQNDIQTSLSFNNDLVVGSLTATEIVTVLEHGLAALPDVNGRFPQLAGLQLSFDPDAPSGARIEDAAFVDESGNVRAVLVNDGVVVNADAEYGVVTLGFLATGGDGYPFPTDWIELALADTDGDGLDDEVLSGDATFAYDGTEQDAFAEYLLDTHATADTAYDVADTGPDLDTRIVNLAYQTGADLDAAIDDFLMSDTFLIA